MIDKLHQTSIVFPRFRMANQGKPTPFWRFGVSAIFVYKKSRLDGLGDLAMWGCLEIGRGVDGLFPAVKTVTFFWSFNWLDQLDMAHLFLYKHGDPKRPYPTSSNDFFWLFLFVLA